MLQNVGSSNTTSLILSFFMVGWNFALNSPESLILSSSHSSLKYLNFLQCTVKKIEARAVSSPKLLNEVTAN